MTGANWPYWINEVARDGLDAEGTVLKTVAERRGKSPDTVSRFVRQCNR